MFHDPESLRGRRIVVGLSGGVDSAVAALRLRDAGADVHALHMTNWADDDGYCTAAADLQDARDTSERLGIPLHHVNFAREYREQVFSHFLDEYRAGRTPNPDVLCNRKIKFGVFRDYAKRLGADLIATGHYARCGTFEGAAALLRAADARKDQSYFLHAVSAAALAETVFPLGGLAKSAVRAEAREHGLPVHDKKDSTGICFIGERPFREFLARYVGGRPGPMRTPEGRIVGEHQGLAYYTLGQRQGLGIGGRRGAGEEPWYVAAKDPVDNALIVVQGDHPLRYSSRLRTGRPLWVSGPPAAVSAGRSLACTAKVRYRQPDQRCSVEASGDGGLVVHFEVPQADVTPGQYVVFYSGERCLGGAAIALAGGKALALPLAG